MSHKQRLRRIASAETARLERLWPGEWGDAPHPDDPRDRRALRRTDAHAPTQSGAPNLTCGNEHEP